jgi:hypothetical protein
LGGSAGEGGVSATSIWGLGRDAAGRQLWKEGCSEEALNPQIVRNLEQVVGKPRKVLRFLYENMKNKHKLFFLSPSSL